MITLNRKVRFSHPDYTYAVTDYAEYLLGSVALKVNAEIKIEIAWGTLNTQLQYKAATKTVTRLDGGISSFIRDGWQIGDVLVVVGTATNDNSYNVTAVTDSVITVTGFAVFNDETITSSLYGETPVLCMDFYPNLIPNSAPFNLFNLTDRETMPHYYTDTMSTSSVNPSVMLTGTNSLGWFTPADRATVYRSSFTNHIQTFIINHTFNIAPIFLADQLSNVQNGIPPAAGSFKDRDCIKYVYTIDGKYTALDPTIPQTTDGNVAFPLGQTGWFNEFINGRPTEWTKQSLLYYDNANSGGLAAIDYCKVVDVVAKINSQNAIAGSSYTVHVMYLPTNEDQYMNTATNYKTNFIYERAPVITSISGTVQGQNTGDYHFLKDVHVYAQSGNNVEIHFQIDFSLFLTDLFDTKDADNLNYLVFITCQNSTTTILGINQTALIMDVNQYVCNKDDSTLFQIIDEVQFFEYPHCDGQGYSSFNVLPMDTVLMKAQFYVKKGIVKGVEITLNALTVNIAAVHANEIDEFNLESFTINTSGFLPNCDHIQEIEFSQYRDFILPSTDCRNEIRLFRMPTLDISGYAAYELIYPFKVRWEEWRKLQGATRCFPTPTQNWMIYDNESGWSIKIDIKAEVEDADTNHTSEFEHIVWGTIKDPCNIPYSVEINTYHSNGVGSLEEVIAEDEDTLVVATITGDFTGFTVDQLYGILSLDAYGIGGVAYVQEIGTKIPVDSNGVWYGNNLPLMADITKVSNNTVTLTAHLNYLYLPKDTDQYIISARIGYFTNSMSSSGHTLNEHLIDVFTCGELEIIQVTNPNTLIVSGEIETTEERNVFVEGMVLTRLTSTTWAINGGLIDGNTITSGNAGGVIIKAPAHPYTDANVGDTIQGALSGTIYSTMW